MAYTLPVPTGASEALQLADPEDQGRGAERLGAHREAHRPSRGTDSRLGSNRRRVADRIACELMQCGLADAVTVVGDNVVWKLKTAAAPSPSGPPHGSPTAAVVPLPESATEVPKANELAEAQVSSRRPRTSREVVDGGGAWSRSCQALVLRGPLGVTHDRVDAARGQRDGRTERRRTRRGGEQPSRRTTIRRSD